LRTVLFDVDGVLVHGYHARPEKQVKWDATLLADMGADPDRFREELIYDIFIKKVIVGQISLLEALDRTLPRLGYRAPPLAFVGSWVVKDSTVKHGRAEWLGQHLQLGEVFEDFSPPARSGHTKPHKPYFEWISNRIGPQHEPPLFFDDREDVVKGARQHGWEAVQYDDLADVTSHPWVAERLG